MPDLDTTRRWSRLAGAAAVTIAIGAAALTLPGTLLPGGNGDGDTPIVATGTPPPGSDPDSPAEPDDPQVAAPDTPAAQEGRWQDPQQLARALFGADLAPYDIGGDWQQDGVAIRAPDGITGELHLPEHAGEGLATGEFIAHAGDGAALCYAHWQHDGVTTTAYGVCASLGDDQVTISSLEIDPDGNVHLPDGRWTGSYAEYRNRN